MNASLLRRLAKLERAGGIMPSIVWVEADCDGNLFRRNEAGELIPYQDDDDVVAVRWAGPTVAVHPRGRDAPDVAVLPGEDGAG